MKRLMMMVALAVTAGALLRTKSGRSGASKRPARSHWSRARAVPSETQGQEGVSLLDDVNRRLAQLSGLHQSQVDAAQLAMEQPLDAEAQAFAMMMRDEHRAALEEVRAMADEFGIEPALEPDVEERTARLVPPGARFEGTEREAFAPRYLDFVIESHVLALDDLEEGGASDAKLSALLDDTRAHLQRHLAEARMLRQQW